MMATLKMKILMPDNFAKIKASIEALPEQDREAFAEKFMPLLGDGDGVFDMTASEDGFTFRFSDRAKAVLSEYGITA